MLLPSWSDITYRNDTGDEKVDFKKLKMIIKNSSLEVLDSEICLPAVQHFNLFHDTTPSDKFVSFFFGGNDQKFQLNYTKKSITPQLLTVLVEFSKKFSMNLYISEFCFITGKNRKESNVASTNVITMDLDKKNIDIEKELPVIQKICKDNGLNLSAVMRSGRGNYLVFKLDEPYICATNFTQLNRWKYNYDQLCDLFQEYEADYKCKDISRVFRLMGSYNYKDNTHYETKFLYIWNNTNTYTSIPICKKTIGDNLFDKERVFTHEKKASKRKSPVIVNSDVEYLAMSENTFFHGQNKRRLNDLIHLICMRPDHLGDRHLFLYVIINQLNVSGYTYKDALSFVTEKVNPKFSLPESEYEIVRQLQSVYKDNKLHKETIDRQPIEYVDNHYHSNTTEWIIKTLKITEAEQSQLSVLKSKDTLKKLRQERRLAKSRCHTQNKKEAKKNSINQMAQTHSVSQIAEKTNMAKSSVYKKLDKTPKQIQAEKENALILKLKEAGLTIADIAIQVGLSYDVVKKRLQRMRLADVKNNVEVIEDVDTEILHVESLNKIQKTIKTFADLIQVNIDEADESPPDSSDIILAEDPTW